MALPPPETTVSKTDPDTGKKRTRKTAKKAVAKRAPKSSEKAAPKMEVEKTIDPVPQSLQHMQVSLFSAGLGLAGFATAWREAAAAFEAGAVIATALTGIAFGVFAVLLVLYMLKILHHRDAVIAEFRHPIQGNFFATITMTLMILSSSFVATAPGLATVLWATGAIANMAVTVSIVTLWISRDGHISHATPVWFIPVVGNLITPIMGVPLGYPDLGWMVFAVGLLFWLILFTVIFYRLLFERALEKPLRPTLFILIAPPSLCFIAYAVLNGGRVDGLATMFLGIALFMLLILLPQVPTMLRLPFGLSWWSYTFPLAAFSIALTLYSDAVDSIPAQSLALAMIVILSAIVVLVSLRTIGYIRAGRVFRPIETPLPTP